MYQSSKDKTVNNRGKELIDLCISHRIRIFNGRYLFDSLGNLLQTQWKIMLLQVKICYQKLNHFVFLLQLKNLYLLKEAKIYQKITLKI